jgi:hypothetical protein
VTNSTRLSLVLAAVAGVVVVSCAKGSAVESVEGTGGHGGASGNGGSSFDGPAPSSGVCQNNMCICICA